MRKLVVIATALVSACSGRVRDGGLIADVRLATGARASCVDVRVKDTAGTELGATTVPLAGKREIEVAIGSKGWPRDVVVTARPLFGPDGCGPTAKPNGPIVEKPATFPSGSIERVFLDVGVPAADLDGDRDGFVGAALGGPDCNDNDPNAFPGAAEGCMTLADLDCNGLGGCADPQCNPATGCAQPADRLAFSSPPRTVDLGACSGALDVETRNASGVAMVPSGTAVAVAASPASGVLLFADPACTTAVTSVTSTAPQSRFTFYLSSATATGTVDVTASSGTLTPATQAVTVTPPLPSKLVFASGAQTVASGSCSAVFEVEARDLGDAPRMVAATTPVMLEVSPSAAVQFFRDSGCTMAATSVDIAAGAVRAQFWVKAITAGTPMVTATAAGLGMASQPVTVTAGLAAKLTILGMTQGVPVNGCSNVVEVRAEDAQGNPATLSAPITVDLTASGVPVTLHAGLASCMSGATLTTVPLAAAANSLATFFFKGGSTMGSATLRAGVAGNALTAGTQVETIGVGPPDHLAFTTGLLTVQAGACSAPVTVQVQDSANNPRNPPSPILVTLTGTPAAGFTVYSDTNCNTLVTGPLMLATASQTFRFRGQTTPTQQISAGATGLMPNPSQTHTITAAQADRLVITTPAQNNITAGTCSTAIHLDVQDRFTNLVSVTNLPLAFSSTAASAVFHGAGGCATAPPANIATGSGTDFTVTATMAGALPVRVTSGSLTAATQTETVVVGSPSLLQFEGSGRGQVAGVCTSAGSPLLITTRDSAGNPVNVPGGLNIALENDAGFAFYATSACGSPVSTVSVPVNGGQASLWFMGQRAGTWSIIASATNFTSAVQPQTISAAGPAQLFIVSGSQTTAVGQCSPSAVQVQTRDPFGNLANVPAGGLTVSVDGGSTMTVYGTNACASAVPTVPIAGNGNSTQFWYRGTAMGTASVTIASNGYASDSQTETVTPSATHLKLLGSAQTLQAGACSAQVFVETQNAGGSPVMVFQATQVDLTAAAGLTYYSDQNCATPITSVTVAANGTQASFYFRGITGGAGSLGVTSTGMTGSSQAFTITPAVHTGACAVPNGEQTALCPLGFTMPSRDRTFFVFQLAPPANNANAYDTLLRCHLADTANVVCQRGAADNSTTTAYWQTATFPTAVTVNHMADAGCVGDTTNVTISTGGNTNDVFVLHAMSATGGHVDNDEADTVRVTSTTQLQLRHSINTCASNPIHDLQVVKWSGASVTRGSGASMTTQPAVTDTGPLVNGSRTILLYSWRTLSSGNDPCERDIRGWMPDAGVIQFNRGNGSGQGTCYDENVDDLAWERVELPAGNRVQQIDVSVAAGQTTGSAGIAAVDVTRTLVLSGANTAGGQSRGETNNDNTSDTPDDLMARFSLNPAGDLLTATRVGNTDAMKYTVYVVELDPR